MSDAPPPRDRQKALIDGIVARVRRENAWEVAETACRLEAARAEAHRLAGELAVDMELLETLRDKHLKAV